MVNRTDEDIVLYAVGDVASEREDPGSIFQHVGHILSRGDIVFCQLESVVSQRGILVPQARLTARADPKTARALKDAGFNVVSLAGNHCMDWGHEAFLDTIDALEREGHSVIGAGRNIEEARRPAIVECKGTRIAFLAYNSILPLGYWATADRAGCAPMRVWTLYEQIEPDQPGTPCRIHTFPYRDDLEAMVNDIKKAKSQADLVIMSIHWGIHITPAVIAAYQREIGHVAINSGVDLILGHHSHILKGIEVYAGKVIFYGLGNFALDLPLPKGIAESPGFKEAQRKLDPGWEPDPEFPTYPFPRDSRKTIVAKCIISSKAIKSVSFLPAHIYKQFQPEVLTSKDKRFNEVVRYVEEITRHEGLDTKYTIEADEVIVQG